MRPSLKRVRMPQKLDYVLLITILLMAICSFIAIYAAFPLIPLYLNPPSLLFNQAFFYGVGFIAILVIMYVSNDNLRDFAKIGYFIIMGLLLYLFIDLLLQRTISGLGNEVLPFANSVNGANSWLLFPVIGTIQPSEFMKVILIVLCAYEIKDHNEHKTSNTFKSDILLFIKIARWAIPPLLLIFIQPDTGIFIIIVFALLIMLSCSGIRKEWVIVGVVVILIAVIAFFYLFYFNQDLFQAILGDSYRTQRIYGWLQNEELNTSLGMQLYQSLLAIGSSGVFGHGIHSDVISIIEPQTDFIFAVIGMNFGLIGCLVVVSLSLFLDFKILSIALHTTNQAEKVMLLGFIGMLIFQQAQNIGMVIGLLPITGITLPLISYGGSSLLSYMLAFGIIMNISRKTTKLPNIY